MPAIVMGLDQHRAQITAEWIDPRHRRGVARSDRAGGSPWCAGFLARFEGRELEVALEATTGWRFVVEELRPYARRQAGARALQATHYGIGALSSVVILAELGDCSRFSSSREAVRLEIRAHAVATGRGRSPALLALPRRPAAAAKHQHRQSRGRRPHCSSCACKRAILANGGPPPASKFCIDGAEEQPVPAQVRVAAGRLEAGVIQSPIEMGAHRPMRK